MFANDHLANSRIRAYPDFLIGMAAEHRGPYEWFKPWIGCEDYTVKGSPEIAAALFNGMTKRGIRMFAQHENLKFDDNISVPVLLTNFAGMGIPMVPVLQNCTVPPIPDQHRCYAVGEALGDFIRRDLPSDMRVALLGSGRPQPRARRRALSTSSTRRSIAGSSTSSPPATTRSS